MEFGLTILRDSFHARKPRVTRVRARGRRDAAAVGIRLATAVKVARVEACSYPQQLVNIREIKYPIISSILILADRYTVGPLKLEQLDSFNRDVHDVVAGDQERRR